MLAIAGPIIGLALIFAVPGMMEGLLFAIRFHDESTIVSAEGALGTAGLAGEVELVRKATG